MFFSPNYTENMNKMDVSALKMAPNRIRIQNTQVSIQDTVSLEFKVVKVYICLEIKHYFYSNVEYFENIFNPDYFS